MSEVLLITGPPGAGKSTASREFAKTTDGMWACIEQDAIRQLVKSGFKNPSDPWTKDTETQMNVSIDICGDMAKRYQQAGINCIIDCFAPLEDFDEWAKALKGVTYRIIVFLPEVEEAIARNNQRTGDARLKEAQVKQQHEWLSAWRNDPRATILDPTNMDVQGVVRAIANIIES